jgi:dihydroflavonol-4-reductase
MKVAITGASGHIGNCLVRELVSRRIQTRVLVHKFENDLRNMPLEIVKGDLFSVDSLNDLCEGVDIVYHLAAKIAIDEKDRELVYKTNVQGTQNLVNSCIGKKVKKLVHFSSIHALNSHPPDQVIDETRSLVNSEKMVYDFSKANGERIVIKAAENGLDAVIVNPTAVVGPYDYQGSYLGQALKKIFLNKLPMLIHGGYDWVDVRDVVDGAIKAAEKGRRGERYLLSGHYCTLKELSEMIGRIGNKKTPKYIAPMFLARIGRPFIALYANLRNEHPLYTKESLDILKHSPKEISSGKAANEFGYHPRPLEETLTDTFKWYEQENLLK